MSTIKKFTPLFYSLIFLGLLALMVHGIRKAGYHIAYLVTASMPRGLYLIAPIKQIAHHDLVEFIPPTTALIFLKNHHWIPDSGLLIKYVFAVPGDYVCIHNKAIWVNKRRIGSIYRYYEDKKLLPHIKICGRLRADEYLLLSTKRERSFDGRYFGLINRKNILGRAVPIFIVDE